MPIGTSKIGVLGAGTVPGGCQTFNAPGTFSVPPGVSRVNITGRGGTGNPGNPGNPGNSGNLGIGGTGGGGGGITCSPRNPGGGGGGVWNTFPIINNSITLGGFSGGPPGCQVPSFDGGPGPGGTSGNAGSAGSAGSAGNPGGTSSGLGQNFTGGAGGAAGNAGNAGNGGGGGGGGNGGGRNNRVNPCGPTPGGGNAGNGGCSAGNGGAGGGNVSNPSGYRGGAGGGGAGATNSGSSGSPGDNSPTCPIGNRAYGTSAGNTSGFSVNPNQCWPVPSGSTAFNVSFNPCNSGGMGGGGCAGNIGYKGGNVFNTSPINANLPSTNQSQSRMRHPICSYGPTLGPITSSNPAVRSGGGGGGGAGASTSLNPNLRGAGGGGGGGRGGAGGAGGSGGTGGSGSAGTPSTFNCVSVTPGGSSPITVASGGQIVISWNPQ